MLLLLLLLVLLLLLLLLKPFIIQGIGLSLRKFISTIKIIIITNNCTKFLRKKSES